MLNDLLAKLSLFGGDHVLDDVIDYQPAGINVHGWQLDNDFDEGWPRFGDCE